LLLALIAVVPSQAAEHRVLIANGRQDLEKQLNEQAAQGWEFAAALSGEPALVDELLRRSDWGGRYRRLVVMRKAGGGERSYRVLDESPAYLAKPLAEAGAAGFHLLAAEPDQKSVEGTPALVVLERTGAGSSGSAEIHMLRAGLRKTIEKQLAALLTPGKALRAALPLGVGALAVEIVPAANESGGEVLYLDDKLYRTDKLEARIAEASGKGFGAGRLWVEGDRVTVLMVRAPAAPKPPLPFSEIDDGMLGLSCVDGAAVASDVDVSEDELVCVLAKTANGARGAVAEIEIRGSVWGQLGPREVGALIETGLAKVSGDRCLRLERLIGWRPEERRPRVAAVFVPC
jgi:hypothetical protein